MNWGSPRRPAQPQALRACHRPEGRNLSEVSKESGRIRPDDMLSNVPRWPPPEAGPVPAALLAPNDAAASPRPVSGFDIPTRACHPLSGDQPAPSA
jgi:hypothetical protein